MINHGDDNIFVLWSQSSGCPSAKPRLDQSMELEFAQPTPYDSQFFYVFSSKLKINNIYIYIYAFVI